MRPLMRSEGLILVSLLSMAACRADAPSLHDGGGVPPGKGPYATVARCFPVGDCPGSGCAEQATGKADGKTVDLRVCGVLDLGFTGGIITPKVGQADVAIALGRVDAAAGALVEGSADGSRYEMIGFLNKLPASGGQATEKCLAAQDGSRALLDIAACNPIANVSFLRITRLENTTGSLEIDALEALEGSFQPAK